MGVRNKKWAVVLIVLILVVSSLSGCLSKQPVSDTTEDIYWWHIDESFRLAGESQEAWQKVLETEDDREQELLLLEMKRLESYAQNHVLTALNLTNDTQKKEYARLLAESMKYHLLYIEDLINITREEDVETAKIYAEKSKTHMSRAQDLLFQANSIKPER